MTPCAAAKIKCSQGFSRAGIRRPQSMDEALDKPSGFVLVAMCIQPVIMR